MSLFEPVQINKRFTGTVHSLIKGGWWIVLDSQQRKHRVASSSSDIKVGQKVAIIGGQIIGKAGKEATVSTYQV